MERIVQKFSIVFISRGERTEIFHSVEEIPEDVRRRIARTARASQVETLLIANEKGRELLQTEGWEKSKAARKTDAFGLTPRMRWTVLTLLTTGVGLLLLWVLHLH